MAASGLSRRAVLSGAAAIGGLAIGAPALAQGTASEPMRYRGVNYDTGTDFGYPGYLSRMSWHESDVRAEIAAIRQQLNCTAIQVMGTIHDRLQFAMQVAGENGLAVWLHPRIFEKTADEQLAHLAEAAKYGAAFARSGGELVFNTGCEATIFQTGLVPGATFAERIPAVFGAPPEEQERIRTALNAYLARAVAAAREHFDGPISYGAGSWEAVDWSPFDIAGVNLYRDAGNRAQYRDVLRRHMAHDRPLVITEFGTCTFEGAGAYGAGGYAIIDYTVEPPRIPEQFVRSEQEQARENGELLEIFAAEGVHGAFVYNFLAQFDTHAENPREDLDMASHAIVKVRPAPADAPVLWQPKLAFHEIARLYGGDLPAGR